MRSSPYWYAIIAVVASYGWREESVLIIRLKWGAVWKRKSVLLLLWVQSLFHYDLKGEVFQMALVFQHQSMTSIKASWISVRCQKTVTQWHHDFLDHTSTSACPLLKQQRYTVSVSLYMQPVPETRIWLSMTQHHHEGILSVPNAFLSRTMALNTPSSGTRRIRTPATDNKVPTESWSKHHLVPAAQWTRIWENWMVESGYSDLLFLLTVPCIGLSPK